MKFPVFFRNAIQHSLHSLGYELCGYQNYESGLYESVYPGATYAPWNKDQAFLEIYNKIQSHTLVDKYRCFELWSFVGQSKKIEGGLIEIGVWKGGTGALVAKKAQLCGIDAPVYLCDTFKGVVKATEKDSSYRKGEHADTSRQTVQKLLDTLGLKKITILEGTFPEETSHIITEEKFRFCHIDVDVYQSAKDIIGWIWNKMPVGGIIVYDDYGFHSCNGIRKYVEEQSQIQDRIILHNLNGHAVVIKIR